MYREYRNHSVLFSDIIQLKEQDNNPKESGRKRFFLINSKFNKIELHTSEISILEEVIDLINMLSKRYKLAFLIKLFTHITFIYFI